MDTSFYLSALIWLILCLLLMWLAAKFGRSPLNWFVIALVFSPCIALVVLLVLGFSREVLPDDNIGPYREPTSAEQEDSAAWQLQMVQKRSKVLEDQGKHLEALSCFAQFIASTKNEEARAQARLDLSALRARLGLTQNDENLPPI